MAAGRPEPVNEREAREAFHTFVLRHLRARVPVAHWRVKGGVNLRLFFGSARYSEDMDLDADLRAQLAMRSTLRQVLIDLPLRRRLVELGIRDILQTDDRPAKDTDTTLRYKVRLVIGGGVALPTKVEVSYRARRKDDSVLDEAASAEVVRRYLGRGELPLVVPHYDRTAAIRQKIAALAGRAEVQSRDVFDLAVLCDAGADFDLGLLRKNIDDGVLDAARNRAFELDNAAYESQVLEFLDGPDRDKHADRWEEYQLTAAMLVESILTVKRVSS